MRTFYDPSSGDFWATIDANGKLHHFTPSPFNPKYARSRCGMVYGVRRLYRPGEQTEPFRECKRCIAAVQTGQGQK